MDKVGLKLQNFYLLRFKLSYLVRYSIDDKILFYSFTLQ